MFLNLTPNAGDHYAYDTVAGALKLPCGPGAAWGRNATGYGTVSAEAAFGHVDLYITPAFKGRIIAVSVN